MARIECIVCIVRARDIYLFSLRSWLFRWGLSLSLEDTTIEYLKKKNTTHPRVGPEPERGTRANDSGQVSVQRGGQVLRDRESEHLGPGLLL